LKIFNITIDLYQCCVRNACFYHHRSSSSLQSKNTILQTVLLSKLWDWLVVTFLLASTPTSCMNSSSSALVLRDRPNSFSLSQIRDLSKESNPVRDPL
jgi:hypothetical protein